MATSLNIWLDAATQDRTASIRDTLALAGVGISDFADVSSLGLPVTNEYPFGICFAVRHDDAIVNQLPDDDLWNKMSSSLTEKSGRIYRAVQELLESWGYYYSRIPSTTRVGELPVPGEELPQKMLATLSGMGWIGKSTLLVTEEYGPRVRIGALLTDMPLDVSSPVLQSKCNNCRACVGACPVQAIRGNDWSQTTSRDELLDVSRCYDYLWSAKNILGRRQTCGICLKVCPIGQDR